ncbi:MAG: putative sugar nucleotidyl transferase [Candidatus Caldarchaeum sp.]
MVICVFEDSGVENLGPLTSTRPAYGLLCGTSTLLQKILQASREQAPAHLFTRPYLAGVVRESFQRLPVNEVPQDEELLLVNGCMVVDEVSAEALRSLKKGETLTVNGRVAAAKVDGRSLQAEFFNSLMGGEVESTLKRVVKVWREASEVKLVGRPWDLVELSASLVGSEVLGKPANHPNSLGRVYVGEDVDLSPQAFIDGRKGPVVLDNGSTVEPFCKLVGPIYVGVGSVVLSGSVVVGSCIGPVCKVGGEVDSSVIMGYSNKRHYGFLGHSVVGEWVNFGAGTTVSNLKNTYGTFKPRVGGTRVDSGRVFMGSFFGDHVKTSIGCMVSGGLSIGVCSHLYREVNTDVPAFTIHTPSAKTELYLDSAITTAKRMMARRDKAPTETYVMMLETLFKMTHEERRRLGVKPGKASFYNS